MADTSGSRDRAFEALDFIINVLKEHEKTLDNSIRALAKVTEQRSSAGASEAMVEKIEQKLDGLQTEVTKLVDYLSNQPKVTLAPPTQKYLAVKPAPSVSPAMVQGMPSMVLNCRQWEDFQRLATQPQALSFSFNEVDKVFQAEAVKDNQIITYSGSLPSFSLMLRAWLCQQAGIVEQNIFEGSITKEK